MGGWLRVVVAFIKRQASDITAGWVDKIDDAPLNTVIKEVLTRVPKKDPARGRWCVDSQALSIWVDASSHATSVSLVYDGAIVKDACWLRPAKDSQHINLTELDAIIKGINLAILWKTTILHLFTDSACVPKWISDTLTGKARVQTKAASEMFIRWRLDTIIKLVKEYALSMNVSLVKSSQNKANQLTRVPQSWLDAIKRNTGPVQPACTASMSSVGLDQIKIVHRQSSLPGVRRTLYFVKQIAPRVSKATVKTVIRECEECQLIDPAPMHWSNAGDASSNNTSNENQVIIVPRRSTRRKIPPPECFMCDHRIRGKCSSNAMNNLTSKKQKVCSLCYWHAETRRRKGRKRCDLFYGGECDKPT